MRKPEQLLWDAMRKAAQGHSDVRLERFENLVTVGVPDVLSLSRGRVKWVELKARPDLPARAQTPVLGEQFGLSREQRNWHLDWARHGGTSLILVRAGKELMLFSGWQADDINAMAAAELRAKSCAGSWPDIINKLRSGM